MALLSLTYRSDELKKNTNVQVVIPDCNKDFIRPLSEYKVVYLLHGLSEDASSWIRKSNVERYANARKIVAVMPSADRSFYCDGILGANYFTYITKELPEYLHKILGLSRKREDNYIMGFSMGGYGAAKIALSCREQYKAWGSLSGVLDFSPLLMVATDEMREEFPFLFEIADEMNETSLNPINLLTNKEQTKQRGYIACGLEDDLLCCTKLFQQKAESLSIPYKYVYEEKAKHDWDFWENQIDKFFEFILEDEDE